MNHHTLTFMIVVMGAATVFLSVFVAVSFWREQRHMSGDGKKLATSLHFQLMGEAVIGLGTLAFSILAWSGNLSNVPIELQSILRAVMFFCTSVTTVHLFITVKKMSHE